MKRHIRRGGIEDPGSLNMLGESVHHTVHNAMSASRYEQSLSTMREVVCASSAAKEMGIKIVSVNKSK